MAESSYLVSQLWRIQTKLLLIVLCLTDSKQVLVGSGKHFVFKMGSGRAERCDISFIQAYCSGSETVRMDPKIKNLDMLLGLMRCGASSCHETNFLSWHVMLLGFHSYGTLYRMWSACHSTICVLNMLSNSTM